MNNSEMEVDPPDPREIRLDPVPGQTMFQHCRTGPRREYSAQDPRIVQKVLGAGTRSGSWNVQDTFGAMFMIYRDRLGNWWEVK